jgi:2-oxoglutarate ferredoxin oxidoreductase subunit gamma
MERAVVFAGFGGQGVLFAGHVLAQAAMTEGRDVLWIPTYGPEMRGGTAACTVIVSDTPIGSPAVDRYDAAVVLNGPSLDKYGPRVAPGGVLVVNGTLVPGGSGRSDIEEIRVACTALARDAGDDVLVSVVALGALLAHLPLVTPPSIRSALEEIVGGERPEILRADLAAFDLGAGQLASAAPLG